MGEGSCRCVGWPATDIGGSPSEDPRGMNACRARGMGSVLFESLPEPGVGTSSVSSYSGTTWSVAALSLWWCAVYVSATYTCTHSSC